jgi:hypothetical protein
MAISNEEQQLRDETRTVLLEAIKASAQHLSSSSGSVGGASLKDLAEAYAILTDSKKPSSGFYSA